jgi:hypothetical protein
MGSDDGFSQNGALGVAARATGSSSRMIGVLFGTGGVTLSFIGSTRPRFGLDTTAAVC